MYSVVFDALALVVCAHVLNLKHFQDVVLCDMYPSWMVFQMGQKSLQNDV